MKRWLTSLLCVAAFVGIAQAQMNPGSLLTRPNNATAYAQNALVASNTAAGSVVVPFIALSSATANGVIPRVRLTTNKTTGWDGVALRVRLWAVAPTYTNGDGGAYAVATGAANLLGQYDLTLTQLGDGATGIGVPAIGTAVWVKLSTGTSVFWDVQYTGSAALTPAANQTFNLVAEIAG